LILPENVFFIRHEVAGVPQLFDLFASFLSGTDPAQSSHTCDGDRRNFSRTVYISPGERLSTSRFQECLRLSIVKGEPRQQRIVAVTRLIQRPGFKDAANVSARSRNLLNYQGCRT
jgi:hypothetical protein